MVVKVLVLIEWHSKIRSYHKANVLGGLAQLLARMERLKSVAHILD